MPLVRLEVKNEFGYGDPELYRRRRRRSTDAMTEEEREEDSSKAALDGVAVAGLVGILRQLGDLTEFAADIFHDLHQQVTATSARGRKMFTRVRHVEAALPSLEKTIQGQRSHVHFAYVAGSDWHADLKTGQSQLLSTDLPRFMMDSYEECHDPPRLYLLDKFDTGGIGACLKRYSDPSYFKRVWAKSELEKAEKDKKETKAQKLKRKRPGLKNEVQSAASSSWHGSSACFASLSIDEQFFSAETASVSDSRFKPELASRSTSFGSRTRLNYVEQVPDTDSTRLPDDLEYDRMSNSKLQMNHNGPSTPDVHEERNGNRTGDNFIHGTLQGNNSCRSPFVRWIEKAEIVKPVSPETCDDTLVGYTQDAEPLDKSSEQSDEEHGNTAELGMSNQDKYDFASVPLQVYSRNHLDEPASETENYMDACNTLDSETETDSECHTKRELRSQHKFKYRDMKCITPIVQEMATRNSFFSGVKISAESQNSFNGEEYPSVPDLVATECSGNVMSLHTIGFTLGPDHSSCNEISDNNVLNMSISSGFEVINSHKPPESSLCGPFIQQPELINMTTARLEPQGLAPVDDSSIPATKFWSNGSILGLEPSKPLDFSLLNIKSKENISCVNNSKRNHSKSINTSNLHYNSMMGTKSELLAASDEIIPSNLNSVEDIDRDPYTPSYFNCGDLSDHKFSERTETVVQQINPPRLFQSFHDTKHDNVAVKRNSQKYLPSLSLSECDKVKDSLSKDINTHLNGPDNTVAKGAEVSVSGTAQPNEFAQNTIPVSGSLSASAQRILANGFERKASITDADILKLSKAVNMNNGSPQDTSLESNQNERPNRIFSQTSHEQNIKEKFEPGSSKNSISSCSHDSEHSSPPLEHMKIPFYPMNGLEISKLKLEFLNGTLHKSNEDVMFPSFQLLPGPTLPFQASGSESDDETLSRSCPYTSEDFLSPHSDSNSEIWEQGDKSDSKSELYTDLHRISVANASLSNFEETKQNNQIGSAIGFGNFEADSGISYFRSPDAADLPGHDSFISTSVEGQGECGSLPSGPEGFAMQSPNEQPPLPPLPPMEWRMTKVSFAKDVDQGSRIAEPLEDFNIIHTQRSISDGQQEEDIPKPPPLPETMVHINYKMKSHQNPNGQMNHHPNDDKEFDKAQQKSHHIQDKHDHQKLIGHQESKVYGSNGQEGGEKEDFLYQIRNKTFNLRRTDPVKPSLVPQRTTNINVAAILEKANAIRQACAGSDDGSENDNWSDG